MLVLKQKLDPKETSSRIAKRRRMAAAPSGSSRWVACLPIHHIKIQIPFSLATTLTSTSPDFRQFLGDVSALGLKILITEMDVQADRYLPADVAKRGSSVGDLYYQYLSAVPSKKAVALL